MLSETWGQFLPGSNHLMTVCFRRGFSFFFRARADVLIGKQFCGKFGPLRMRGSQLNPDAELEQVTLAYSSCLKYRNYSLQHRSCVKEGIILFRPEGDSNLKWAYDSARALLMYSLSVHRTVYPVTINPTPSSQRFNPLFCLSLHSWARCLLLISQLSLLKAAFAGPYFSAKTFTGTIKIELTLSVSHLPGGMGLCQAPSWKVCCGLNGLRLCRPSAACLEGRWGTTALWASFLPFLNHSAALHVLQLQRRLSFVSLDPGFHPPTHCQLAVSLSPWVVLVDEEAWLHQCVLKPEYSHSHYLLRFKKLFQFGM